MPEAVAGSLALPGPNQLRGADLSVLQRLFDSGRWSVALDSGIRYLGMEAPLTSPETPAEASRAATARGDDRGVARNQFYGGQLGLKTRYRQGPVFVDLLGRLGLGATHQTVGTEDYIVPTQADGTPYPGPYGTPDVVPSTGSVGRDTLTVLPEVGVQLGMEVSERMNMKFGYNVLYWSNVLRPGADRAFDATAGRNSSFWAQGLNLGLEVRY